MAVVAAVTAGAVVVPAQAAPGDPVSGFGTNGVVTTRLGTGVVDDQVVGIVRQSDGKLVLVSHHPGFATVSSIDLLRLHADGRVDTSFGTGGRRTVQAKPSVEMSAVASQGNKILVAGSSSNFGPTGSDVFVARLNRDGSLDTTFSGDGRVFLDLGEDEIVQAVAAGPGGTVLVAGQSDTDAVVLRLTASGALDATYGAAGVRSLATGVDSNTTIDLDMHATVTGEVTLAFSETTSTRTVRLTPSGVVDATWGDGDVTIDFLPGPDRQQQVARWGDRTYVVAGGVGRYRVFAFTENALFDNTFSGDGREVVAMAADPVIPTDVAVDFSGALVVTGVHDAGDHSRWSVVRVQAGGGLDPTFAGSGEIDRRFDGTDGAHALLARSGGYVVVGLRFTDLTALALRSNGTADSGFGNSGVRTVNTSRSQSALELTSVTTAPGGRFLAAGTVSTGSRGAIQRFALLRYRSDGRLDTTFSRDGIVTPDIVGRYDAFDGARQLSNGKVLAWGTSRDNNSTSAVVMRFTPTGRPDRTFGTGGRREFASYDALAASTDAQLVMDSEGRAVIAHAYDDGVSKGTMVRRLRPNGSDDTSFGSSGHRLIPAADASSPTFLRLRNGRPYVLDLRHERLTRLTASGALDASFGVGGILTLNLDDDYQFGRGVIMPDGRVVALRRADLAGSEVLRLRPNGTPDPTFSDNGVLPIGNIGAPLNAVDQLTVMGNGTILLGGYAVDSLDAPGFNGARSSITRVTPSGEIDTTFSGDGRAFRDVAPGYYEISADLTIAPDGDPVLLVVSVSPSITAHLLRVQR